MSKEMEAIQTFLQSLDQDELHGFDEFSVVGGEYVDPWHRNGDCISSTNEAYCYNTYYCQNTSNQNECQNPEKCGGSNNDYLCTGGTTGGTTGGGNSGGPNSNGFPGLLF